MVGRMSDLMERLDRGEVIERVRRHLRDCCVAADAEAVVAVVLLELWRQGRELDVGEGCGDD
jgi:hypothetical protein